MIPTRGYTGQKIALLGLGRSGCAAGQALLAEGADVMAWDDNPAARARAEALNISIFDLHQDKHLLQADWLVISPGIPHLYPAPNPIIARALHLGIPLDNDIGLFFRSMAARGFAEFDIPPRVVAVTGSNGKSTTAALIHHILQDAGRPVQLAGNIGRGVMDIDPPQDGSVIVLELSSYQTELARALTPDIAVLTNISPDHLDRHAGLGGYFAAKRRLFAEGGPDRAIIGVDETEGQFLANQMAQTQYDERVIRISSGKKSDTSGWTVFARKGFLSEFRKGKQIASIDLRDKASLPGAHNHQNACAAYAACRALGLAPRVIEQSFYKFSGLPHRSEIIATHKGITFVNDSKATNPDAAAKALDAFQNIRWICGGLPKEGGLGALAEHLAHVKKAYVIGRDAQGFALALGCANEVCSQMQIAVARAFAEAEEGDTILLAPAAASFDQYDNFEKRGDDFTSCVKHLLKDAS